MILKYLDKSEMIEVNLNQYRLTMCQITKNRTLMLRWEVEEDNAPCITGRYVPVESILNMEELHKFDKLTYATG